MEKIPSELHGVTDYLTAGMIMAVPRLLKWPTKLTQFMTMVGLGTIAYSLMTKYELGLFKLLPFKAHMALDTMNGAMMAASPILMQEKDRNIAAILVGIGAMELGIVAMSEPEAFKEDWADRLLVQARDEFGNRIHDVQKSMQHLTAHDPIDMDIDFD
jgi:hypothetical protein